MRRKIREFLNSDKDERDFFIPDCKDYEVLSDQKLMLLKDYLAFLKSQEEEFKEATKYEVKSIKSKCDWVENIGFNGFQLQKDTEFLPSFVTINGNGTSFSMSYDELLDKYRPKPYVAPRFLCLTQKSKCNRDRVDSLDKVQAELTSIDFVGQRLFNGLLMQDSISGYFGIDYEPFEGVLLSHGESTLAFYESENISGKNNSFALSQDQQEKALSKILVKK